MARKKKFALTGSISIEYFLKSDLVMLKHIFEQALKEERSEHHVSLYEDYDKCIKTIDDEMKRN